MCLGKNLGIIIKREQCKIGWLAEKSGVSSVTVGNIIRGRKIPRLYTIRCIFDALGYELYLVAPDGQKRKYETISGWIKFIMRIQDLTIEQTSEAFNCTKDAIYNYLREDRGPSIYVIKTFADNYGYTIKIVKDGIEYDLFEPIDIWQWV